MNHKTIKLFGGPQDGAIVEVLHSAKEYPVEMHYADYKSDVTESGLKFIYRETPYRAANGEVIFSIYDRMP